MWRCRYFISKVGIEGKGVGAIEQDKEQSKDGIVLNFTMARISQFMLDVNSYRR